MALAAIATDLHNFPLFQSHDCMSEDCYKLSPFYGRKIIFEIFFLLQRMEGLNVPVDYAVLSFASKNSEEKLGASAALWGSQKCSLLFKNAYSVFS